jgi:hypothetical protein
MFESCGASFQGGLSHEAGASPRDFPTGPRDPVGTSWSETRVFSLGVVG